jgi:hypothetical protein
VDSKTWNSEGLDLTLEESETLKEALKDILPGILRAMMAAGLIDPKRVSDRRYLWSVVKNHLAEQLDNVGIIFERDKEFLAAAKTATKHRQPAAAVVLLATLIEHKLNTHHRIGPGVQRAIVSRSNRDHQQEFDCRQVRLARVSCRNRELAPATYNLYQHAGRIA